MARPIWKGHISFGLVNVPIVLYAAEQRTDLHFNLIDSRNHARVRYERVNEVTGEEVPWNKIVKGYEYADDNYVLLSDEDFKRAAVEATQTIAIENCVDAGSVAPLYVDKPYYLVPGKHGAQGFVLLREALRRTAQVAIAKVVIRARQHLAALAPHEEGLILLLLRFPEELRDYGEYDVPRGNLKTYKITAREMQMAEQLVESLHAEWKPERYHDDYRLQLRAWIEKKASAGGVEAVTGDDQAEQEAATVVNIADLLKRSIKQERGGGKAPQQPKRKQRKKKGA